jgi:hypothetical protein
MRKGIPTKREEGRGPHTRMCARVSWILQCNLRSGARVRNVTAPGAGAAEGSGMGRAPQSAVRCELESGTLCPLG